MRGEYERSAIISPDLPLMEIEALARESGESDLLLQNERGELAGLLSLDDLGDPEDVEQLSLFVLAADLVNRRSVSLRPDDNLIRALEFFGEGGFDKLPIVESSDGYDRLLGYVRYRDIIGFYQREHNAPSVPEV
jgi:CBS domain-containing protein